MKELVHEAIARHRVERLLLLTIDLELLTIDIECTRAAGTGRRFPYKRNVMPAVILQDGSGLQMFGLGSSLPEKERAGCVDAERMSEREDREFLKAALRLALLGGGGHFRELDPRLDCQITGQIEPGSRSRPLRQ